MGDQDVETFRNALGTDARDPFQVFCHVFPELLAPAHDFGLLWEGTRELTATTDTADAPTRVTSALMATNRSKLAQAFEREANTFLVECGVHKKLQLDFSDCNDAFSAVVEFTRALDRVFGSKKFDAKLLVQRFRAAEKDLEKKEQAEPPPGLEDAFQSEYIGQLHLDLYDYLSRCWVEVKKTGTVYRYPYFAIVQSSGFGKTRLLRELAVHFNASRAVASEGLHRLVYVNVRDVDGSTGFPPRTKALASHLFPGNETNKSDGELVEELANRMVRLFQFVMQPHVASSSSGEKGEQPRAMHDLLMDLFSGKDSQFTEALKAMDASTLAPASSTASPKERRLLVLAVDEARTLLPKSNDYDIGSFRRLRRALGAANAKIKGLSSSYGVESGIIGIVVDTNSKISNFVPSAVMDPSQRVPKRNLRLFPPFVLTQTMDVLHPTTIENGKRVADTDATKTTLARYQKEVIEALRALYATPSNRSSWLNLRKLGRPLWLNLSPSIQDTRHGLIELAAQKLLCALPDTSEDSYSEKTLNGVAAVMCRVGIRPYSSSPMAAGIVADYMAVLSYVSHTHDQFVSTYSSDPILTLGATRVWHSLGQTMLAQRMLPQLRKLLHQEVMDTGQVGELVARIVLLLAMDACARLEGESEATHWSGAGEFFSVWTLLTALQGSSPTLRVVDPSLVPTREDKVPRSTSDAKPAKPHKISSSMLTDADESATQEALEAVESQWKDWFMSFTHFVQLAEAPSEACLWAMLGRRAAGVMPRGQKAVDLVIPICTGGAKGGRAAWDDKDVRVSMILVQVKNMERADSSFPSSATVNMRPCEVFLKKAKKKVPESSKAMADAPTEAQQKQKKARAASLTPQAKSKKAEQRQAEKNKFAALGPDSVLRIYMSMRSKTVQRFYLEDTVGDTTSHVLCLKGLGPLSINVSPAPKTTYGEEMTSEAPYTVNVLAADVVEELQKLLPPWWKVRTLVEQDIDSRDEKPGAKRKHQGEPFGIARDKLVEAALKPMAETVLLNNEDEATIPPEESRLGRMKPHSEDVEGEADTTMSSAGQPKTTPPKTKKKKGGKKKTKKTGKASR